MHAGRTEEAGLLLSEFESAKNYYGMLTPDAAPKIPGSLRVQCLIIVLRGVMNDHETACTGNVI